jgi:hypothetical protein
VVPDYMVMGERGMYDMKEMEMELPPNTFPMMAGQGQFGPVGMGGMFTLLKVRADQAADDYRDPGHYAHPPGTVAYEYQGPPLADAPRGATAPHTGDSSTAAPANPANAQARKPSGHAHH